MKSINNKHIVLAFMIYLLWVIGFAFYSYQHEKQDLYSTIDQQLESAALTAPLLLPKGLHHQAMSVVELTIEQDYQNTLKLSEYTDESDIAYIYTMVLRDQQVYFTTSSATLEERELGEDVTSWFDLYDDVDPGVINVFKEREKTFLEYTDQWGTFRSIFIPQYAEDGTYYVTAADLTIDHIQSLLARNIYHTIAISLLFLLFVFPLFFVYTHRLNRLRLELEEKVQQQTSELAVNEERLKYALATANQGWFDLNLVTNEILVSDEYPKILGFEPEEFHSNLSEWLQNVHPDDLNNVQTAFKQCQESGGPKEMEYRRKAKNGNWIWIHSIGEIIEWDKEKTPTRMIGIHMDVTDRIRNEQVLRALAEAGSMEESDIFKEIVSQLALTYNVSHAFIACIDQNNKSIAETVAVWAEGDFMDNISYSLKGTPCQDVTSRNEICFYTDDLQELFPEDQLLVEMSAKSYVGVPLVSSHNEVLGLMVVLNDKAMTIQPQQIQVFNSLAARASIELERREADKKLKLSARVFSEAHEGIFITYPDGEIVDVNPTFCEITGYQRDEVIGQNPRIFSSGKQSPEFYKTMWKSLIDKGHWQGEVWNCKKDGELYAEMLTISSIDDETGQISHYVGLFSDITESKEQQKKLELMAHYDVLTQLPNRALFADRFGQAIAHSKRSQTLLAICFLDLDNFKLVNDNYGHKVGDELLIEVARRIKLNIREEDTVSRQGGDEFTLLLGDLESYPQCEKMLQRLLLSLSEPYLINDFPHGITASIGLSLFPYDDADLDTLLRHADQSMYQAKLDGRNRYHLFNPEQDHQTIQQQDDLQEVERALAAEEFQLYFQPKVNMKTGEVYGAEALIRWINPEKGVIPPLDFLPKIEGTDLEIEIGDWVVAAALKQLDLWKMQDIELQVSVNIACHHLQAPSFFAMLDDLLELHPNVDAHNLQLEILESSALGELQIMSSIIKTCREALGVSVALDDFGTGYSSLSHIRNLSADTIKIDQSFVRDMLDDPNDYAIIDSVIGLSDSFNRSVIAEGVENTQQGLMLLVMGCEFAQGYGIARPMPASEFLDWLQSYTPNQIWIDAGNTLRSVKESKLTLHKLAIGRWQTCFETNINTAPGKVSFWPIMVSDKCYCGYWSRRAHHENLFDKQSLEKHDRAHEAMHVIANDLYEKYQHGERDAAIKGLDKLQEAFDVMRNSLTNN
jgi:diguanylate cyclase (GGDEF)-like protein/PAS domain S-box-containing protein